MMAMALVMSAWADKRWAWAYGLSAVMQRDAVAVFLRRGPP